MKVKTANLIDAPLDWAVGTALNLPVEVCQIFQYGKPNGKHYISIGETDKDGAEVDFEPSEEWSQGGPIIEQEAIGIGCLGKSTLFRNPWLAARSEDNTDYGGPTPLIAAMRCFVASKLGDEIEIPEELLK